MVEAWPSVGLLLMWFLKEGLSDKLSAEQRSEGPEGASQVTAAPIKDECSPLWGSRQYRSSELEMGMAGPRDSERRGQQMPSRWGAVAGLQSREMDSQGQATWNLESHSQCKRCLNRVWLDLTDIFKGSPWWCVESELMGRQSGNTKTS